MVNRLLIFLLLITGLSVAQLRNTPFVGYGAAATGGTNVVTVSNTNASGAGSLAACALVNGNWCKFSVSGTINSTIIMSSNVTIDGFSAPAPGITITGGTTNSGCIAITNQSNIIIQGLRIRNCSPSNTKGIMLFQTGGNENSTIVIDANEIENVTDEDIGSSAHDVTISNNMLSSPASSGGQLVKYDAYHFTFYHNLWVNFTGNDSRVPLVWAGDDTTGVNSWSGATVADVVGNVMSKFLYGIVYVGDGADQDPSNIINNFLDGQDTDHARNGIDIQASNLETHYIAGNASVINPVGLPSTYGCGASNLCGTNAMVNTNKLTCASNDAACQVSTPFPMPALTTSCISDSAGKIAEWTAVINNSGVISKFADDGTAAAIRAIPTRPTQTILAQSWNAQSATCSGGGGGGGGNPPPPTTCTTTPPACTTHCNGCSTASFYCTVNGLSCSQTSQ